MSLLVINLVVAEISQLGGLVRSSPYYTDGKHTLLLAHDPITNKILRTHKCMGLPPIGQVRWQAGTAATRRRTCRAEAASLFLRPKQDGNEVAKANGHAKKRKLKNVVDDMPS